MCVSKVELYSLVNSAILRDKNNKNSHLAGTFPMRRRFLKTRYFKLATRVWPPVFLFSACLTLSLGVAQTLNNTATDPATRAREIAALSPIVEKQGLRKEEVKELSVVMSGVELVLRANIEKLLDIWKFHEKDIPSVSRMRFMHRKAPEQIVSALRPYGYYRSEVDARLSDLGSKWQAVYRIKPGDRVAIDTASVKITGAGADEPAFAILQEYAEENITQGQILDQQLYESIKSNIRSTAAKLGYFDSEFIAQEILVDLESYSANVTLHFNTGERYKVGKITLTQDVDWLSDELLAKFVALEEQEYFDAGRIQEVQSDFSSTSYYRNVEIRASAEDAVDRVIPVSVNLTHRNPKQYIYGAGYGTDTGARVRLGVTRRRVNNSGHHYTALARLSEIGYGLGAAYTIPTRDPRTDSYGFAFNIEEEDSESKNFRSIGVGGNYRFRDGLWFKTYALDYELEENVEADSRSKLLIPSLEWVRTSPYEIEKRMNVFNGNFFKLDLRGASGAVFSDTSFIQAKLSAKKIVSYSNGNRLITRGSIGATKVSDYDKLPLSKRFYTGGDRTVRGYNFEAIAPEDNDVLLGGRYLAELSLEYEVPFRPNFSWAVFTDVGDAFNDKPNWRNGFGWGLRWRSPIGPVRIDAGRGLDEPGNGKWEFHLGIGPDL